MAVNLEKIKEYDFVVVVDGSGSMDIKDVKSGWLGSTTRWKAAEESAVAFAKELDKINPQGIGVVIFSGGGAKSYSNQNASGVANVFSSNHPGGGTPLAEGLTAALQLLKDSRKKKFIWVFTDGVPNSQHAAAQVIVNQANSQASDDECTILFVQVGADPSATAYLRKLDDELKDAKFDIVDAKTAAEAAAFKSTMELILHAIDD
jgi:Mg-chelatase subunit ChlD